MNLSSKISSLFKKSEKPSEVLLFVNKNTGILWERIAEFKDQLFEVEGSIKHHTDEMERTFPLKHHIENGMYTREIFMPKGTVVVSFIHKQNHPSFFLSGKMSILNDKGELKELTAPMSINTLIGTQRVAYMHEDCVWVCVYRTDKKTVEEAEKEVYTEDFRELPSYIIEKTLLCQE